MRFILGLLIGAGLALSIFSIWEKEERKKEAEWEKWRSKLP